MRFLIGLFFIASLLRGADPQFPAAAFYWNTTQVAIVIGQGEPQMPDDATKLPDRKQDPPFWDLFALPHVRSSNGVRMHDRFDINLTRNFWVRATVTGFIYNKTEYTGWMFAIAAIDPDDRGKYAEATGEKLHVFLAEPAKPERVSDTGQIHSPVVKIKLSTSERAALETHLKEIMMAKLREAMRKGQSAGEPDLVSALLGGKAKLTLDVDQVDLGESLGVREHVEGTWTVGQDPVLTIQGWKRPGSSRVESLEAIDGFSEGKAKIFVSGDWAEEAVDDFIIENVFSGGRVIRHFGGYESSNVYLERMSAKGREFVRTLYGL